MRERLTNLLRNCGGAAAELRAGMQAHAHAITCGLLPHATLETDLLLMYSRCSCMNYARRVFDRMPQRNMHSWNILFCGYARRSLFYTALSLFPRFLASGLLPDRFTFPPLLKSCGGVADSTLGMVLHCWVIHLGLEEHVVVQGSVLDMYAKCACLDQALRVFESIPRRDTVIWNTMIAGFARAGCSLEALGLFRRLQWEGGAVDSMSIPSILNACSREGDLMKGKEVHGRVIRCVVFDWDVPVGNSLIDMYAKCGCLDDSNKVFLSMSNRNIVTWSTMISCYGAHGKGEESLRLYKEMISEGVVPNGVTFTSVLSSCSHSGLIEEGRRIFESISRIHDAVPSIEQYACMVDLLGRCGSIKEALQLISSMPMEPSGSVWGALLGACAVHKNVEVGEIAAQRLFKLEKGNPSNYVALCGIYEAVGDSEGVAEVRSRMRELANGEDARV
ncbi:Pentatricopeptide repeat-containing protein, chloroplastic [Ananas comosus]|uniref:Pentatricopeptide repeat-containing protein, chloroplastic n=1 Tax=Ananas comosus TaxID=4615 RepID=A0A199VDY6_ANACO|nr:Pentatricopeptide repeat-containing protein, chloroplastic [Ananas comosus]